MNLTAGDPHSLGRGSVSIKEQASKGASGVGDPFGHSLKDEIAPKPRLDSPQLGFAQGQGAAVGSPPKQRRWVESMFHSQAIVEG